MTSFSSQLKPLVVGAAMCLVACATPPTDRGISTSRSYDAAYDDVWTRIVGFFASNNIPVKNIAKDSGVIFAEASRFDDRYADCGSPGMWIPQGRKATFNVFVTHSGSRQSVNINSEFVEVRKAFDRFRPFRCVSTGVLEAAVFGAIGVPQSNSPVPVGEVGAAAQTPVLSAQGQYAFQVEHLDAARACASTPQAKLTAKAPGVETYLVACNKGDLLVVRCETGQCRVMR